MRPGPRLFLAGLLCGALAMALAIWNRAPPSPPPVDGRTSLPTPSPPPAASAVPVTGAREAAPLPTLPPRLHIEHAPASSAASAASARSASAPEASVGTGLGPEALLIPVAGVTAEQLVDTFRDGRGSGRRHDAIDIMAASGTPVVAVAEGSVAKLFNSEAGGLTVYQFDASGERAFYYAHLERYAEGLAEGQRIARGQLIGYVGHSGNASPDAPHLHFAIFMLGPERRWWQGEAINPYPLLRAH